MKRRAFLKKTALAVGAAIAAPVLALQAKIPRLGKVLWVDSSSKSLSPDGTYVNSFASLNDALDQCSGETTIYMKPGHIETIHAPLTVPLRTTVVGLGDKDDRPRFTYET